MITRLEAVSYLCLSLQFTTLCQAATIPVSAPERRLGILRIGLNDTTTKERAYALLEKRLQHWLENSKDLPVKVTSLGEAQDVQSSRRNFDAMRLSALSNRLMQLMVAEPLVADKEPEVLAGQIEDLRVSLSPGLDLGPRLQTALVAESLFLCRHDQTALCREHLREASLLHPAATVKGAVSWEMESAPASDVFFAQVESVRAELKRSCQISLQVGPMQAEVFLNGFPIGEREIALVPGVKYLLTATAPHYRSGEREIECRRSGLEKISLQLSPSSGKPAHDWDGLRRISEAHGMETLLLVEPMADRFNLYLYTPGLSMDEVPLSEPLKFTSVLGEGSEANLPVAWDAFTALFEKHRAHPLQLALEANNDTGLFRLEPGSALSSRESAQPPTSRWYNTTSFWVIAGTVLVGAVAAYIAVQDHPVKSQGAGIAVKLE